MTLCLLLSALVLQGDPRLEGSYLVEKAGWAYLHVQGSPRDIGYQYGYRVAGEIDDAQRALREQLQRQTGKDWSYYRETSRQLAWNKLDPEYQQEIEGQAEGLKAKHLPYDQWDVLALNDYIEVSEYYLPWTQRQPARKESCSAFVATGSETADGKIVMGQNFWWDWQMGERFNLILDIQPAKGHRVVMDALPGFIHSGTDFAVNDVGLMVTETTLPVINDFDPGGLPEFMRMRKAVQYAGSVAEFAKIMEEGNNGGYANTWLVGDRKTNEIGKLELGLKNVTLQTTKDGYYVGSNFPENPKLISEELPTWDTNPQTNGCEARRVRWKALLDENKGKVDADAAKRFLADVINPETGEAKASDFTLCGRTAYEGANSARVVTSDLAVTLSFWARMGAPDGKTLSFSGGDLPFLHDLKANPWVVMPVKAGG